MKTIWGVAVMMALVVGSVLAQEKVAGKVWLDFKDYPPAKEKGWGYSRCITALVERPLRVLARESAAVYRLIYCPTWNSVLIVTIRKSADRATIHTKQSSGQGGYRIGSVGWESQRELTQAEWNIFQDLFVKSDFYGTKPFNDSSFLDGAEWIMEAQVDGRYYYVVWGDPDCRSGGKHFAAVGQWMMRQVPLRGCVEVLSDDNFGGLSVSKGTGVVLGCGSPSRSSSKHLSGKR